MVTDDRGWSGWEGNGQVTGPENRAGNFKKSDLFMHDKPEMGSWICLRIWHQMIVGIEDWMIKLSEKGLIRIKKRNDNLLNHRRS